MIYNPRTPIIVGTILVAALIAALAAYSPLPGELSRAHARVPELATLAGCESCHDPQGFTAGCLGCHEEIGTQIATGSGYHAYITRERGTECESCHLEHAGTGFPIDGRIAWGAQATRAFKHPHVEFSLEGAHATLQCEACHHEKLPAPFALSQHPDLPREQTFLGLLQVCITCHEDRHARGLAAKCDRCHGQETFETTPHFDHTPHFPLSGGHADLDCDGCHRLPHPESPRRPAPYPFDRIRGETCADCHETPHRAPLAGQCRECHERTEPEWATALDRMTRDVHAVTGFRLTAPHDEVACIECHPRELEFAGRYQDPRSPEYRRREETCGGCHADVHYGQFSGKYENCVDCHRHDGFTPSKFGHDAHARVFPLTGAHEAVACTSCHIPNPDTRVTAFAGTTGDCKGCHQNPHGMQFSADIHASDCDACHTAHADDFRIREYDHEARTGYILAGSHELAKCTDCHVEVATEPGSSSRVRRYRDTPTACASCHRDVHRGQFKEYGHEGCSECHSVSKSWSETHFDHDQQSRFPLRGVHARVTCDRCHRTARLADGAEVVQYKPLGRECTDCHDIIPR